MPRGSGRSRRSGGRAPRRGRSQSQIETLWCPLCDKPFRGLRVHINRKHPEQSVETLMSIAIEVRDEMLAELSSSDSERWQSDERSSDSGWLASSSSPASSASFDPAQLEDGVPAPVPRRSNEPSASSPRASNSPPRPRRKRVRWAPLPRQAPSDSPSAPSPSLLDAQSPGPPPAAPPAEALLEPAEDVRPDRAVLNAQLFPAPAPDMQPRRSAPAPDAQAAPVPALDGQLTPRLPPLSSSPSPPPPVSPLLTPPPPSPQPPRRAVLAPVAYFLASHGTEYDLSRVVESYDWRILDYSGIAGEAADAAAMWPRGPPHLIKPLWAEYALTRDTVWDACFHAAETGRVFEGSVAGRGSAADAFLQLITPKRDKPTHIADIQLRLGVDVYPPLSLLGRLGPVQRRLPLTTSLTPQHTFVDLATEAPSADTVALGVGTRQVHFMFPPTQKNLALFEAHSHLTDRLAPIGGELEGGLVASTSADDEGVFWPAGTLCASYALSGGFLCRARYITR